MIETYKILNNIDKVQYEQILPLSQTTTRGHSKKLYKKNCRTNVRKYSFSQRVVDEWNKIPNSAITLYHATFRSCMIHTLSVLPVSEVWNMGYSARWTLLNKFFSSPGW
jgi:hypothetical protein